MLHKYAALAVIEARLAPEGAGLVKDAHRHEFDYEPRPGFLYVRSRAISSRCNDNFDEFPAEEIKQSWRTFIGKPVFVNHKNDDPRRARGVIVDAALHEDINPDGSPDTWTEVLMEVDAVRFPKLAQAILAGEIDRTSMGTNVEYSLCSFCGNRAATPLEYCKHIPGMKGQRIYRRTASGEQEGVLVREICFGLGFFENSLLVEEPADPTAFFLGVDDRGMAATGTKVPIIRESSMSRDQISRMEEIVTKALGHYNANVTWLLQNNPDATAERVTDVILDRDSNGAKALLGGGEVYVVDQAEWKPRLIAAVQVMLDEIHGSTTAVRTAVTKTASKDEPNALDWWQVVVHRRGDEAAMVESESGNYAAEKAKAEALAGDPAVFSVYVMGLGPTNGDHLEKVAFGEVPAPAEVDTLREDTCPVCGEKDSYNGDECMVCNYAKPPSQFLDPDLDKAKEQDLRQDAQEDAGVLPGQEGQQPDVVQDLDHFEPPGAPVDGVDPNAPKALDPNDPNAVDPNAGVPPANDPANPHVPDDADDAEGKPKADKPDAKPADGAAPANKDEDDDDEDPSKPDFLKKKKDPKKKTSGQIARSNHGEGADVAMRPTLAALAEQQIVQEAQQEAIDMIADLAGIDLTAIKAKAQQRTAAFRRQADVDNPAQPIPDPPAQAPVVTTDEALAPDATDDPVDVGASPLTDVSADATTDVQSTDVVLDVPLDLNQQDVTAPVAGTEGPRPLDEVKIETEQRMGEPTDQVAFADTGWTGGPQTTGSVTSEGRTFASLRLARLRIQAGIADGDDLTLAQTIAADEATADEAIQAEIDTLAKVVVAQPQQQAPASRTAARRLVPTTGAARTVPSMAPSDDGIAFSEEGLLRTAMAVTDEESLFE